MVTREPWNHIQSPDRWIREIRARVQQDWDQIIVITGEERSGKSTFAFRLAHALDLHGFDLDRCVFRAQDMIDAANRRATVGNVIWLDEAIEGGNSREAMSEANRKLMSYFTVAGERNLIYIILFPNLRWLDSNIRDHRADWHVHIPERGVAKVEAADKRGAHRQATYWRSMPWGDEGSIKFPKVSGPAWEAYKQRKEEFVDEVGREVTGERRERSPAEDPEKGLEAVKTTHRRRFPWLTERVRDNLRADLTETEREYAEKKGLV